MTNPTELFEQCKYQEAADAAIELINRHKTELYKLMSFLPACYHGIGDKDKWKYYCHRPCASDRKELIKQLFGLKEWRNGSTIDNIIIPAEEGIGDELLYTTYLHLLEKRANIIYVECDPRLKSLFEYSYNPRKFVFFERGVKDLLQKYAKKCHYFILSSDLTYRLNPEFIPKLTKPLKTFEFENEFFPYLFKHIGISHHTNTANQQPIPKNDFWSKIINNFKSDSSYRFLDLQPYKPLQSIQPTFLSKQIDFYNDIQIVASFINKLDIVITISNTIAHLAGRLHKKCLLITPMNCNTRWLMTDVKNFYPKMTHIRGDWDYVQKRVIEELKKL
jgi:hypothetical protein